MTKKSKEQIRQQLVTEVDQLLYHRGFHAMSFADIAKQCGVSKGNLYYYFKTKEALLQAVIEFRVSQIKLMLKQWEEEFQTPIERLKRYAKIVEIEADNVVQYGCPMGSLNTELAKVEPELQKIARLQLDIFKHWLKKQFKQLGAGARSEQLTMSLMARTQGISIMAQAFHDNKFITKELSQVMQWLDEID